MLPIASTSRMLQRCGGTGRSLSSIRGLPATACTLMALLAVAGSFLRAADAAIINAVDCESPALMLLCLGCRPYLPCTFCHNTAGRTTAAGDHGARPHACLRGACYRAAYMLEC
jgi:hypothetical protein